VDRFSVEGSMLVNDSVSGFNKILAGEWVKKK